MTCTFQLFALPDLPMLVGSSGAGTILTVDSTQFYHADFNTVGYECTSGNSLAMLYQDPAIILNHIEIDNLSTKKRTFLSNRWLIKGGFPLTLIELKTIKKRLSIQ